MKRENYIITVKSIYIRNAEMFCPESMTKQEILNLDDIDIFQSCEFERYWKNAEVSAYLCQMACAEEELKRELQKIAEYFKIPACFLEAIPVKKIWKMIYFIIMERRKMKKALLKKIPVVEAGIKDKQYMELCRQNYLMKVQKATVAHKRTLILNLYDAENIIKEQYQPFCRIFFLIETLLHIL